VFEASKELRKRINDSYWKNLAEPAAGSQATPA
jgi:hypothetical protein